MAYVLLFLSIALELTGTTLLKMSQGFTLLFPTVGCLISYGLCFYIFSKAALSLNLALAYATWSGVGLLVTTMISWFFFDERLTIMGFLGIAFIFTGCILLNAFGVKN